jgi:ABC-type polysaccharide/polyol phosphate export permease
MVGRVWAPILEGVSVFRALAADVREMLQEQVDFRELLYQMTRRDLMLRYKQTVMGFGWAVFSPLINTIIFSVVFTQAVKIDVGMPYPLFLYCGQLVWNFFASSLRFSLNSLTANINLVAKVYFPREIFPFSAVIVSAVDFAVGGLLLAGMMIWYRVPVTAAIAFLPIIVIVQIVFTAGVSLLLAMANLFFRDVKYLFEAVVQMAMFSTSALYPASYFSRPLRTLLEINPMTAIIDAYRAVLLEGRLPDMLPLTAAAAVGLVILAFGWLKFHRSEYRFAEFI